jgi:hypothetical protein
MKGAIQLLVREAEQIIMKSMRLKTFSIIPYFEAQNVDARITGSVEYNLAAAHIGIADISDANPNVMYEVGRLYERRVPVVLTKSGKSQEHRACWKFKEEFADLQNEQVYSYTDVGEIPEIICERLVYEIKKLLRTRMIAEQYSIIWFDKEISEYHVWCSAERGKLNTDPQGVDYEAVARVGNKDALLECCVFLARYYPRAEDRRRVPNSIERYDLSKNLVVIGGPGGHSLHDDDRTENRVARILMRRIKSVVSYSDNCEEMFVKGKSRYVEKTKAGGILVDWGYFARFPNPYAPDSTVVLLNGVHTQGVVGATMAFSNYPEALGNYSRVLKSVKPDSQGRRAFEAVFKVEVDPGNPMDAVKCPIVKKENIFSIGEGRYAEAAL